MVPKKRGGKEGVVLPKLVFLEWWSIVSKLQMLHLKHYSKQTARNLLFRAYRAKTDRFGFKSSEGNVFAKGKECFVFL